MSYNLFLDDLRVPEDCVHYMHKRIGPRNPIYINLEWVVVKNHVEFEQALIQRGMPDLISFDHDLGGDIVYEYADSYDEEPEMPSGFDCAKILIDRCEKLKVPLPDYIVHSSNPIGTENIIALLENYKKHSA